MMHLIDRALSLLPNTPTKITNNSTSITPDSVMAAQTKAQKKAAAARKAERAAERAARKRKRDAPDDDVDETVEENDNWGEDQTAVSVPKGRNVDDDNVSSNEESSESEDSDGEIEEEIEEDLANAQLKSPEPTDNPSVVSDLSNASRGELIKLLEESRQALLDFQEKGGGWAKKRRKVMPSTVDEKKIDVEVTNILRYEIVRFLKFQRPGWNAWSNEKGTVCKMICDKVVNWPMDVTLEYKKKMWCRLFEPS
jgi:hypothetical protein